jgi:hypothetical protein
MVWPFITDTAKQSDISIPCTFVGACKLPNHFLRFSVLNPKNLKTSEALRRIEYDLAGDAASHAASEDGRATVRPS